MGEQLRWMDSDLANAVFAGGELLDPEWRQEAESYEDLRRLGEHAGDVSVGLSAAELDKRPTRSAEASDLGGSCCICMLDVEAGETLRELACAHSMHAACIDEWLKEKHTCP